MSITVENQQNTEGVRNSEKRIMKSETSGIKSKSD